MPAGASESPILITLSLTIVGEKRIRENGAGWFTDSRSTRMRTSTRRSSSKGSFISDKLNCCGSTAYPPNAEKGLRLFSSSGRGRRHLGVTQNHIKKLHLEGKGPEPQVSSSGRRSYTAEQMLELRQFLDKFGRSDVKGYVPHRRLGEELQVISVVNFKGGSGKTTTTAHLAQYLALTGHRVLAIDLDPQASLTALHGIQS